MAKMSNVNRILADFNNFNPKLLFSWDHKYNSNINFPVNTWMSSPTYEYMIVFQFANWQYKFQDI
jgi:hypothetical protein